jgi:hypothetical protein
MQHFRILGGRREQRRTYQLLVIGDPSIDITQDNLGTTGRFQPVMLTYLARVGHIYSQICRTFRPFQVQSRSVSLSTLRIPPSFTARTD